MNLAAFQQSAFLQALGWAIANSVWQAGIFLGLYHILVSSYSNASSKFKNNVSTVFLFISFLWFIVTFFDKFIYLHNRVSETVQMQVNLSADFYSVSGGLSLRTLIHSSGIILPYLSVAYLLLLLFFTIKLINSYRNTIFIKYNGLQKPGIEWRLFVGKVSNHMNIGKKIKLWFSKHVDVPATIGFLKPVILIPVASLNQLTTDQLEAIILHELSHIKRNDYLVNLFISLIETILFFNPFIVLLSNIVKKERENCCDDFVLQYQYDRHSYASALLSLERYRIQNLPFAVAATSGKKQLLFRIKRIMEVKNRSNSLNYGQKLLALLSITGIIFSMAWLSPSKRSTQSFNGKRLQEERGAVKPEINQEKNIILRSKNETTENIVSTRKTIKDKRSPLINIYEKNNSTEEKGEPLFAWKQKDNEIQNNPLVGAYGNFVAIDPSTPWDPAIFAGADNLSSFSKFSIPDPKFFKDLNFYIDIHKLEVEIERDNQSFFLIDWNNIQKEIIENLAKIKLINPTVKKNQPRSGISINKREKDKNLQNKFQFSFVDDGEDNIPIGDIETGLDDSLFAKNNNSPDNHRQFDGNNFPIPPPPSEKRHSTIKISRPFYKHLRTNSNNDRTPTIGSHLAIREKLPLKQSIQICYKDGSIIINGKKISSSELKRHPAQAIVKNLLLDCNNQIVKMETVN